jgi:pyridoxal phosphate enzyme (YggS family)
MSYAALRDNLARVREEIARIQAREALRGSVRIVTVTKGHPPEAVRAALAAGLEDIGENRVQEALEKQEALAELPVRWHLVGHLQTNKAKHVPGRFVMVHSVDSVRVVAVLEKAAEAAGAAGAAPPEILVQVNVAGEEQKYGCTPDEAVEVLEKAAAASHLRVRGLMTMAPLTVDERVQRRTFAALRELGASLEAAGHTLPELSMGMSADYPAAVAEGATIVRLGTVLFGERSHE